MKTTILAPPPPFHLHTHTLKKRSGVPEKNSISRSEISKKNIVDYNSTNTYTHDSSDCNLSVLENIIPLRGGNVNGAPMTL